MKDAMINNFEYQLRAISIHIETNSTVGTLKLKCNIFENLNVKLSTEEITKEF